MPQGRDLIDQANEVAELHRQIAIDQKKPTGPAASGVCLYCEEPLTNGRRWCDKHCRDEWENEPR